MRNVGIREIGRVGRSRPPASRLPSSLRRLSLSSLEGSPGSSLPCTVGHIGGVLRVSFPTNTPRPRVCVWGGAEGGNANVVVSYHIEVLHDRSWHCAVFMPHIWPSNCWNTNASIGVAETCRGQRKYVRVAIAASVNTIQT